MQRRIVLDCLGENDGMVFGKAFVQLSKALIRANIEKFIARTHHSVEIGIHNRRMLMSDEPIFVA